MTIIKCEPPYENLHDFVAARNTTASAALYELPLVIPCYRTEEYSQSILPVAVRLWNLLPSDVFGGGTLSSFKNAMNLY